MIKGGIELYLDWVNLSRQKDRLVAHCTAQFNSFLCDRAVAIFERAPFTDASEELSGHCLDADDIERVTCFVSHMFREDEFCELVYDVAVFWSMSIYLEFFEKLVVLKCERIVLGNSILELYMTRGVWKTFLGLEDFELLETFTSSYEGLFALGIFDDDESNNKMIMYQFNKAHQSLRCYNNDTICRHCQKKINSSRRIVCGKCGAVWFCNAHCMNSTKYDLYCGHFHECDLLK